MIKDPACRTSDRPTVGAEVICRDHQAYLPNDALAARARAVAAVFAAAGITATVRAEPAAIDGVEHYHRGAAPWLVEARLALAQQPWFPGDPAALAAPDAPQRAAQQLARLCWGVAAAGRRLRTPVGALTLVDPALPLTLELPYELTAKDFAALATGALSRRLAGALRWSEGDWRLSAG